MRSEQRVDIKRVIEELGRRAVELQTYRGSLISQIRADPNYAPEMLKAGRVPSRSTTPHSDRSHSEKHKYGLDPATLDKIQKVLLAETSLAQIHDKRAQLSALIAPIHVLPDEILRIIFEEAANIPTLGNNGPTQTIQANVKSVPAAIVLSSVSRRWRNLVMGAPTLWTHIYLSPRLPRSWSELSITRSDTSDLHITLDCCIESTPEPEVLDQLLDIVLPEVARWKEFTVVAHHCFTLAYVGRLLSNLMAPNLETLRLSLTGKGPSGDQSVTVPNLFTGGAPRLSRLYLCSVGLPWDSSELVKGLTCLDLRWMWNETKLTYGQFRAVLSACPDLKELVLRGQYVNLLPAVPYEPLSVPSLRYLEISGDNVSRMSSLLSTPGLYTLHLANVDEAEFRELMQLFERPLERKKYPALQSLRFFNVCTTRPSLGFFEAMAHIEELTVMHSEAARFLHMLGAQQGTGEGGPSCVVPRLQTFTLLDDVSDEKLLALVADRAALGCPLQRVNVHAGSVNVHYRTFLQQFVKLDGLYVKDQNR